MSPASIVCELSDDRYAVRVVDPRGRNWFGVMPAPANGLPSARAILDAWDFTTEGGRVEQGGWVQR